jgi:hypothetical protein
MKISLNVFGGHEKTGIFKGRRVMAIFLQEWILFKSNIVPLPRGSEIRTLILILSCVDTLIHKRKIKFLFQRAAITR